MATILPWIKQKFTDANDEPLVGGRVYTYQAGTTTPLATYSDHLGTVPNTNPIILDASGSANIWLRPGSYKFVVEDADGNVIDTIDHVKPADGGGGGIVDSDYVASGYSLEFGRTVEVTGLQNIIDDIYRFGYQAPTISLSSDVGTGPYEKGFAITAINFTAAIQKRSDLIAGVRFYQGASIISNQSSGGAIPDGGNSTYNWTGSITDSTTFSAQVDDSGVTGGPTTVTSTRTFNYVYPYYYGAGATGKTGAEIRSDLTTHVISSDNDVELSFTFTAGQTAYFAYPASYGDLTQIFDENDFDVTAGWTKSTKSITGLDTTSQNYTVYEKTVVFGVSDTATYRFVR